MNNSIIILRAQEFVKTELISDSSGHDWWHIHRVWSLAKKLAAEERANEFVCELAALLHDIADEKLNASKEVGLYRVHTWLEENQVEGNSMKQIIEIISTMSFDGGYGPPMETLEGMIVQDADRLDAMGAIGIARAFVYAGWKGHLIYDPDLSPRSNFSVEAYRNEKSTAINHFYEKLLKLKDLINTDYAKKLAQERHRVLEAYLLQFYQEWEITERNK